MNDAYRPDWYYDDLRQVGTDFENAETVAAYDRNQGTNDAEDEALLDGPPADLVTTKYACTTCRISGRRRPSSASTGC